MQPHDSFPCRNGVAAHGSPGLVLLLTVELSDQVDEILKKLLNFEYSHMILSLVGMAGIGLEMLKLRCCAFRGPVWKAKAIEFQSLRFLLLEDMDLVQWTADEDSEEDPDNFSCLFVSIRHIII